LTNQQSCPRGWVQPNLPSAPSSFEGRGEVFSRASLCSVDAKRRRPHLISSVIINEKLAHSIGIVSKVSNSCSLDCLGDKYSYTQLSASLCIPTYLQAGNGVKRSTDGNISDRTSYKPSSRLHLVLIPADILLHPPDETCAMSLLARASRLVAVTRPLLQTYTGCRSPITAVRGLASAVCTYNSLHLWPNARQCLTASRLQ
jgi:hypothetical protein